MTARADGTAAPPRKSRRPPGRATSDILEALADKAGDKVAFADIAAAAGSRTHGFGLLIFALPELLPIPFVGFSTIVAVPLILLALHLLVYGERSEVAGGIRRRHVPAKVVRTVAKYAAPAFRRIEAVSRPRLAVVAERHRLIGLACLVLGVILAAPIPLANFLPALCTVLIAFGMIQRDGVIVLAGLGLSAATVGGLYFAADKLRELVA